MPKYYRLLFFFACTLFLLPLVASQQKPQAATDKFAANQDISPQIAPLENFDIRANRVINKNIDNNQIAEMMPGLNPKARNLTANLLTRLPDLQVRWQTDRQIPRLLFSYHQALTSPNGGSSQSIARQFLQDNRELLQLTDKDMSQLNVVRDYTSQHNGARHLAYQQEHQGLMVFGAEARFAMLHDGSIVSVNNELVPNLAATINTLSPQLTARQALARAANNLGLDLDDSVAFISQEHDATQTASFSGGHLFIDSPSAKLMLFPLSESQTRLVWQVRLVDKRNQNHYALIVDAVKGTVLMRHSLTWYFQSPTSASFRVFTGNNPQPNLPFVSTNPPFVDRQFIVTSGDPVASPNGWVDAARATTIGNNVDARTDPTGRNVGGFQPTAASGLVFDFPLTLNTSGKEPETFRESSVTNLFYYCNWIHDYLYKLGFDEISGNFQVDNFNRGGFGKDPVVADAQDGAGFNNANFSTSEDGNASRMQMYLWKTATPKVDASYDAEVIIHEYVHGLSTRLVGGPQNVIALFGTQSGGMGEGWSDWYAMSLLSKPGDNPRGVFPYGSYVTRNFTRGIRRFAYSTDMNVNKLTYADIDPSQTKLSGNVAEVHNVGEVWCQALWEVRANFIDTLGFEKGKAMIEQLVTDGLKLSATNPTLVDARDAILLADQINNGGANQCIIWDGFAKRGLGFGAASLNGSISSVKQSFNLPPFCSKTTTLALDHKNYFDGDMINISLGDADLINSGQQSVTITSSLTGDQESLMLTENAKVPGQFTGSLQVSLATIKSGDGVLQSMVGDTFTVTYNGQGSTTASANTVRAMTLINDTAEPGATKFVPDSSWKMTTSFSHSPSNSWTDSPKGDYRDNANTSLKSKKINLTGMVGTKLVFWQRYDIERDFDFGYVEVKVGNAPWRAIASFTGTQAQFKQTTIDLSELDGQPKVRIRFHLLADGGLTADGWYLDDIQIIGGSMK